MVDRVTKTKMCCPLIRWRWYNSFIWGRQYFWLFFLVCNIFFFAVVPLIFWGLSRFLIRTAWIKPLWTLWTALDFGDFGHPKILPFLSWGALGSVFWLQTNWCTSETPKNALMISMMITCQEVQRKNNSVLWKFSVNLTVQSTYSARMLVIR